MSYSYDETYDVYDETFPRARKPHTCFACKEVIPKGHRYTRVSVIFHGEAETYKRCARCQTIHEHLRTLDPGELWPDEQLDCGETYEDHWNAPPPLEVAMLAFQTPAEAQRQLEDSLARQRAESLAARA